MSKQLLVFIGGERVTTRRLYRSAIKKVDRVKQGGERETGPSFLLYILYLFLFKSLIITSMEYITQRDELSNGGWNKLIS